MRARTRKFKRRQRHSSPFGLFLAAVAALLPLTALAPRANAGSTDYGHSEYPLGSRPRPELFSQSQGVLINQPLASNYSPNLASNVALGGQPGGFQPSQVDATFSWTGATNTAWSLPGNWSPSVGAPPGPADTAVFNGAFTNQPRNAADTAVGSLLMTTGVAQNVTLSSAGANTLTINGTGIPVTGILVDNTSAFTLTISARLAVGGNQAWTNNSGNLFTVSGTVNLTGSILTVNGTGDTLISGNISGAGASSTLTKNDTGTLTLTGANSYAGTTIVNGGTLLANGTGANHDVTVNGSGTTLGGTGQIGGAVTVQLGASIAPGNGGNTTGILAVGGSLTLAPSSNFLIDINGTTVGTGYDRLVVNVSGVTVTGSNLVVHVGTTLSVGQTFQILTVTSGSSISGVFQQGSTVTGSDGTVFAISYTGGNGNDVVLTVIQAGAPEPSTWIGGALAVAGLAFTQRRRLRKLIALRCGAAS